MIGRGSRIHLPSNKLMFRVYDYTNATRLLGKTFAIKPRPTREQKEPSEGENRKEKVIRVEGFDVHINPAGKYIVPKVGDKIGMLTIEEYTQRIASCLIEKIKTIDELREFWVDPNKRKELIEILPDDGRGLPLLRELKGQQDYDLYDILAEIGFGIAPKKRRERAFAFQYKHKEWLNNLPQNTRNTLIALANQFEKGGIEELENTRIFQIADVDKAGGLSALKVLGRPSDIIIETKRRLLAG